jgi:flagellar biosynthesis/type III secretory pathway protein FliH
MSLAILKSPTLIHQRLSLGDERTASAPVPMALDPRIAIEAQVRAELQAEFDARLETIKDEAHAEGYKQGLTSGHEDGHATAIDSFKKKQALLEQVLQKAESQLEAWLESVSEQALEVARDTLCQFVSEQALNPTVLQDIIKRVTANLRDADVLSIRLYPSDCSALRNALKQTAGAQPPARIVGKLVEDSSLEAGGIVVETPRGEYRATLDVQLKKLLGLLDAQRQALPSPSVVCHAIRA